MFVKYIFFFLFLWGVGESAELVLFLACDTQGKNVETSVYHDIQNIRDEAIRISHHTGLQIREEAFIGSELNVKTVLNSLKNLNIHSDDVLLFYFTGHGYRTASKKKNPWPNLYFTQSGYGLDFDKVISILSNKKPRLLIAFADCCNNIMGERKAPPVYKQGMIKKKNENVAAVYWKLFIETNGEILITSSEIGEYSWCTSKGAIFTTALLESIKFETEKGSASWEKILKRASLKVKKHQHPYYVISPPSDGGL